MNHVNHSITNASRGQRMAEVVFSRAGAAVQGKILFIYLQSHKIQVMTNDSPVEYSYYYYYYYY